MKDWKIDAVAKLIAVLLKLLKPSMLIKAVDAMLDFIEDAVQDSENQIDDMLVLPIIALIRTTFGIPDDDD